MTENGSGLPRSFRAFRVEIVEGKARRGVQRLELDSLPDHDVLVRVAYSSLNYKDALSADGRPGVTRNYPHTPGIDAAGVVAASRDPAFPVGSAVLCTGYDLGMDTPGGFAEYVRVPGAWLVPMPEGLDARGAMVLGTAGFTAQLALEALHGWIGADAAGDAEVGKAARSGRPMVVTGASGGVGTLAVALLAAAGHEVVASTGTASARDLLTRLGAASLLDRQELAEPEARPLPRASFAGGVDTVGGTTLANLVKRTDIGGAVAACGNAGGMDLPLNVFPFILRGVGLLGIDSQHVAMERRVATWKMLAAAVRARDLTNVPGLVREIGLDDLDEAVASMLVGGTVGRLLVRTGAA